jgi:hypothetical protein
MNSQDIYNLHEAYIGVYADLDEERAPGVKPYEPRKRRPLDPEKAPSGEKGDGSGYGEDKKFNKPDDKIKKPGTEVPAPKKGGYGRIFSNIPYGIGAHANRNRSRNSTVRGMDPGAPRSEKLRKLSPEEKQTTKKKPSREIVRNQTKKEDFELWVSELLDEGYDLSGYTWEGLYEEYIQNEAYDIYDVILSHLINEGYADSYEAAEAIMVNMSEDWMESICEASPTNPNLYKGKHGQTEKEYMDNRSDVGKLISGDSHETGQQSQIDRFSIAGGNKPNKPGERPKQQAKLSSDAKGRLRSKIGGYTPGAKTSRVTGKINKYTM